MRASTALGWVVVSVNLVACGGTPAKDGPLGGGGRGGTGGVVATGGATTPGTGGASAPGTGGTTVAGSSCRRPFFAASAPWNTRADTMPVDSQSAAIIAALQTHGWGAGRMQIDSSIHVMCDAAGTAPKMAFTKTDDFYNPDCDAAPVPVPAGGHIEGEAGYSCTGDGDCHLIVVAPKENRIYEQWRADITGGLYKGGCLAIWDTATPPPTTLRGDGCTSADAGGFPISALLFDADEVAAGHIDHAIRFILPNDIIRKNTFVRPATHATNSSGGTNAVPYGARLRLRSDRLSPVLAALPSAAARVVAQAMHDYGIILSDGGNIALTSEDDENTTAKWSNVMGTGLGARDLQTIMPSDFEMVDGGTRYDTSKLDCPHVPLTQ